MRFLGEDKYAYNIPGSRARSSDREMACFAARSASGAFENSGLRRKKRKYHDYVPFLLICEANSTARSKALDSGEDT